MMKWIKLLALLPFIGVLGGAFYANRVTPFIFGMPFLLFNTVAWLIIESGIMWLIYHFDPDNKDGDAK